MGHKPKRMSKRLMEALSNLDAVSEAIPRDAGRLARYEADGKHIAWADAAERLAKRKLCQIDKIGQSSFARITPAGRAALTPQKRQYLRTP
jgi:hypothetical protein